MFHLTLLLFPGWAVPLAFLTTAHILTVVLTIWNLNLLKWIILFLNVLCTAVVGCDEWNMFSKNSQPHVVIFITEQTYSPFWEVKGWILSDMPNFKNSANDKTYHSRVSKFQDDVAGMGVDTNGKQGVKDRAERCIDIGGNAGWGSVSQPTWREMQ